MLKRLELKDQDVLPQETSHIGHLCWHVTIDHSHFGGLKNLVWNTIFLTTRPNDPSRKSHFLGGINYFPIILN